MNGANADDQTLVEACRAGNPDAFGHLVTRYQNRLLTMLYRLTGNQDDALDALQNTFLVAYRKLNQYQGESAFYTWIYRIAVNLVLSDRRRRKNLQTPLPPSPFSSYSSSSQSSSWNAESAAHDPPDPHPDADPSAPLISREREQQVQTALNSLAPDHRAVVVLKEIEGLRYEEIAEVLGIPIGTVRSRLHRARGELRELLRHVLEEEPLPKTTSP